MIYLDNGPVAKSQVFQQVMRYLNLRGDEVSFSEIERVGI